MNGRERARVWAIVQARTSSTRLPGKVLADLGPGTTTELVLRRLGRAEELDGIVVATSTDRSDDELAAAVEALGTRVIRGPLDDVLARYALAAREVRAEGIVRITADCPLVDPSLVDSLVALWRSDDVHYAANIIEPRTFPKGLDVEVVSRSAIDTADAEASAPPEREHVTPYIRARPDRFPAAALEMVPPLPDVRVTLDTEDDLRALRELIARVGEDAGLVEIVAAFGAGEPTVRRRD
jgi:spore coat polysaccharide biosynthesis protein SpsF (cytidylyltransferase family)